MTNEPGNALAPILEKLPDYEKRLRELRESILSNLIMIGEIPAPTFKEEFRVRFLQDRFAESGLPNSSTDEVDNAVAIMPGSEGRQNILLVSHLDTVFSEKVDHTVTVEADRVVGPAIGDNALGLAILASLPMICEHLEIELRNNLILLGATRSLGRGDLEGVRFFLENSTVPIVAGISVEGFQLGRLSYTSAGMLRGEIACQVPDEYDWTRFGAMSAIQAINEVLNGIAEIPLPRRPRTSIILSTIEGGTSFDTIATQSTLHLEIRSESGEMADEVRSRIEDICAEVSSQTAAEVSADFFSRRLPGGIQFNHPLALHAREIMKHLGVEPRISSSVSEISAFTDRGIPAVRLAITNGENINTLRERLQIEPIFTGIAQLLGVLLAIDAGLCHEH